MLWNRYIYFQNNFEIKTSGCTYWGSKIITINLSKIGVLPIVLTLMKFFIFTKIGHVIFQTHFNALLRTFQNQRTLRTFRQKLTHFTTRVYSTATLYIHYKGSRQSRDTRYSYHVITDYSSALPDMVNSPTTVVCILSYNTW